MGLHSGRWNAGEASKFAVPHRGAGVLNFVVYPEPYRYGKVPFLTFPTGSGTPSTPLRRCKGPLPFLSCSPLFRLLGRSWRHFWRSWTDFWCSCVDLSRSCVDLGCFLVDFGRSWTDFCQFLVISRSISASENDKSTAEHAVLAQWHAKRKMSKTQVKYCFC